MIYLFFGKLQSEDDYDVIKPAFWKFCFGTSHVKTPKLSFSQ